MIKIILDLFDSMCYSSMDIAQGGRRAVIIAKFKNTNILSWKSRK